MFDFFQIRHYFGYLCDYFSLLVCFIGWLKGDIVLTIIFISFQQISVERLSVSWTWLMECS
jgi:hypothetical protein